MTILHDKCGSGNNKKENALFSSEKETCIKYFERWSENHQIEFVQHLLSRMCHYQHGNINTYLKPMLQRDFISLLPSKFLNLLMKYYQSTNILSNINCDVMLITRSNTILI